MRQTTLQPQFVDHIPELLEDGVLYISQRYRTATHRCCCGCGEEVVTPLGPADWTLQIANEAATLHPSIGNWSLPCRSHYWIRNSKIVWAGSMTPHDIKRGRIQDQLIRDTYFAEVNQQKEATPREIRPISRSRVLFDTVWRTLRRWLGRFPSGWPNE